MATQPGPDSECFEERAWLRGGAGQRLEGGLSPGVRSGWGSRLGNAVRCRPAILPPGQLCGEAGRHQAHGCGVVWRVQGCVAFPCPWLGLAGKGADSAVGPPRPLGLGSTSVRDDSKLAPHLPVLSTPCGPVTGKCGSHLRIKMGSLDEAAFGTKCDWSQPEAPGGHSWPRELHAV